jgi:diguanylate cyclase (GGDEF)-like protein
VTVSIGLSNFPNEATIASQLLRVADYRLYQAKEGGRNRVIG